MKKAVLIAISVIVFLFLIYWAVTAIVPTMSEEARMTPLKPPLSRLTQTVNSASRYKKIPSELRDMDIVKFATASNPALLAPLDGFGILVKQVGSDTVLLLCTPDYKRPLLEDLSSTPEVDRERWRSSGNVSGCEFTLP